MDLSIVIPVWNEENKIGRDLERLNTFIPDQGIDSEVIVVDDGSDDATRDIVMGSIKSLKLSVKLIAEKEHRGKGYAVRQGILSSFGEQVMFMDCGGNVPLEFIQKGLSILRQEEYNLVHGSRHLPGSKIIYPLSLKRRLFSLAFKRLTRGVLNIPPHLTDTQCGFKLYEGNTARLLYKEPVLYGFLFDLEIILRAINEGLKIKEFPIVWSWDPDSRLQPNRIYRQVFEDLMYLKRHY